MGLSKLTNEQLLEIAKQNESNTDKENDIHLYLETFHIVKGSFGISANIIYNHYKKWSTLKVTKGLFIKRVGTIVYLNKYKCSVNWEKEIGEYYKKRKKKKRNQEEKR